MHSYEFNHFSFGIFVLKIFKWLLRQRAMNFVMAALLACLIFRYS